MAHLTNDGIVSLARLLAGDVDAAGDGVGLNGTEWFSLVNEAYQDYSAAYPEAFTVYADETNPADLSSGSGSYDWTPITATTVNVRRVVNVQLSKNGALFRNLERIDYDRMIYKQVNDGSTITSATASDLPLQFAARSKNIELGTPTTTVAKSQNTYNIRFFKIPSGGNFATCILRVSFEFYPPDLSGTSHPLGLGDQESRWVARLAACRGAVLLGRPPDFVQGLRAELPMGLQGAERAAIGRLVPRIEKDESVL